MREIEFLPTWYLPLRHRRKRRAIACVAIAIVMAAISGAAAIAANLPLAFLSTAGAIAMLPIWIYLRPTVCRRSSDKSSRNDVIAL